MSRSLSEFYLHWIAYSNNLTCNWRNIALATYTAIVVIVKSVLHNNKCMGYYTKICIEVLPLIIVDSDLMTGRNLLNSVYIG